MDRVPVAFDREKQRRGRAKQKKAKRAKEKEGVPGRPTDRPLKRVVTVENCTYLMRCIVLCFAREIRRNALKALKALLATATTSTVTLQALRAHPSIPTPPGPSFLPVSTPLHPPALLALSSAGTSYSGQVLRFSGSPLPLSRFAE